MIKQQIAGRQNMDTLLKNNQEETAYTNKTKFIDSFSEEVFKQTYRFGNEKDINERHLKVAENLAQVEKNEAQKEWKKKFSELLEDFKFVPGGRITSNAGTSLKGTTYINCFVSGFRGEDQDSMSSIMDELKRQALILKSEGGYGFCANVMRPRGAYVDGIGGDSPGAIKLLEMWDTQSSVITAGSGFNRTELRGKKKIRKGAQMVTMSIWHPDIIEFITAKQTPGRLTKFNMSVLITDEFMNALKNKTFWHLEFPDFENHRYEYKKHWDGNIKAWKEKGLKTKIYKRFELAEELWDLIMQSTYNRNEPGVLFVDTINYWNNLYYKEHIQATNPCGEQVLPIGGVCLLGSFNLTQFINKEKTNWDYEKLSQLIPIAIRFMDNVNDVTQVPLIENQENLKNKRRIGLGVLGYASALMMMKIKYGSEKALVITDQLANFIMNTSYRASALLAKEKGAFIDFDYKKYLTGHFVSKLDQDVKDLISQYGIRNSHLLSIQPTGNSAVLANNVSGGIEPIFSSEYIRTVVQPSTPNGLELPETIDWRIKKINGSNNSNWFWIKEGDDDLLKTSFAGEVWKIDQQRGLLKENHVMDYAVRYHRNNNSWEENQIWATTAQNLELADHINTMRIFSKYVDSAISKTVNLPNNFPFEKFKALYFDVYSTGTIKGCTTYREGTMASVLSTTNNTAKLSSSKAIPRPPKLNCDIFHVKSNGIDWIVFVGLVKSEPYEVFALKQSFLHLPQNITTGFLIKESSGIYHLETNDGWILKDIRKFFESDEQEALTRMISTALRHQADIEFVVDQLLKSEGTINSFSKAIGRTLKKYVNSLNVIRCADCMSSNIKLEEGCFTCLDCGSSKCT